MINSPQINPYVQNGYMPDDCDRVSSLVGFNVNGYLNQPDTFTPQNMPAQNQTIQNNNQNAQTPIQNQTQEQGTKAPKNKKDLSPLYGAITLGVLGLGTFFAIKKGKGLKLPFKLPGIQTIKTKIGNLGTSIKNLFSNIGKKQKP